MVQLVEGQGLLDADIFGEQISTQFNTFFFISRKNHPLSSKFSLWFLGCADKSDPYAIMTCNKQKLKSKTKESKLYKDSFNVNAQKHDPFAQIYLIYQANVGAI